MMNIVYFHGGEEVEKIEKVGMGWCAGEGAVFRHVAGRRVEMLCDVLFER